MFKLLYVVNVIFLISFSINPIFLWSQEKKQSIFEKRLKQLWEKEFSPKIQKKILDSALNKVENSALSAKDKFELSFFLTQLEYFSELKDAPFLSARSQALLSKFLPAEDINRILRLWATQNFKQQCARLVRPLLVEDSITYQLNKAYELWNELQSYEIPEHSRVAEIGAGDGLFAAQLKLMHPNITLFVNEISADKVASIANQMLIFEEEEQKSILTTLGSPVSCNLEGQNLDRIIVRNTFHHFSEPENMLSSFEAALKREGKLYLLEQFKGDTDRNEEYCAQLKERSTIEKLLKNKGWQKDGEIYLEKQKKYLMIYSLP